MLRISIFALTALLLPLSCSLQAAIIGSPGAAGPGTGAVMDMGVNAGLVSSSVMTTTAGGSAGNTVEMTLEVYAMDALNEFQVIFPVLDGMAAIEGTTTYAFAVTLVNKLGENGEDPGDAGKEINGLNIGLTPGPFAVTGFSPTPAPGIAPPLPAFPLQFGGVVGTTLMWGGANGGGGGIPFMESQTFTFTASVFDPNGAAENLSGSLGVVMVANPEPATLCLAGLALIPGGIAVRRRRRKKAAAEAAAQAV